MELLFTISLFLFLIPVSFLLLHRRSSPKNLPPGGLGVPVIGQSLSLLRAMKANTAEQWLERRVSKYGPISKLTLFGKPTVFIHGQAANKFVFTSDSNTVASQQTQSIKTILGDRNIFELGPEDHKRVRDALVSFLKPESLKQYVGNMEEEIKNHLESQWQGKEQIKVLPSMKILTFNIICSLLFGVERGALRDEFLDCFHKMIEGMWSVPINLPFTRYNNSIRASARVQELVRGLILKKRAELEQKGASPRQDLITYMLSIRRGEDGDDSLTVDEIVHNVMLLMVAGYDTSSVLLTFILRLLANDSSVYAAVLKEHEDIAKSKGEGEPLTWQDLAKMKYSWRVAMETLRLIPPVFGGFRKAVRDIEFEGYIIPKGWQIFWASSMTHMDGNIFPEPTKFDPARFESQVPPYCFVAFGGGPRICPGSEFARIETLVTLHYLVTKFTWKLLSDNFYARDPMPVPTQGLLIEIAPKKTSFT